MFVDLTSPPTKRDTWAFAVLPGPGYLGEQPRPGRCYSLVSVCIGEGGRGVRVGVRKGEVWM